MRELCTEELSLVQGANLYFTSSISFATINSVANASTVAKALTTAFGAGYAVGTWLNNTFDLSTKIVDALEP
jgi:hypothetical protein